jgi:hypothetical protein
MLPSKMRPTSSSSLLKVGEPELPPVMSLVVTKLKGVFRSSFDFRSVQRGARLYGNLKPLAAARA